MFLLPSVPQLVLSITLLVTYSQAIAIHKCIINNVVTYSDLPCPALSKTEKFNHETKPPSDPKAAEQMHLWNKIRLKEVQQERIKKERKIDSEAQQRALNLRLAEKKQQQKIQECLQLEINAKKAKQKRINAKESTVEVDRLKEKHATTLFQHNCK